jgi:translation initiation factor 2 alpha subunit (eIF-2alpha)
MSTPLETKIKCAYDRYDKMSEIMEMVIEKLPFKIESFYKEFVCQVLAQYPETRGTMYNYLKDSDVPMSFEMMTKFANGCTEEFEERLEEREPEDNTLDSFMDIAFGNFKHAGLSHGPLLVAIYDAIDNLMIRP